MESKENPNPVRFWQVLLGRKQREVLKQPSQLSTEYQTAASTPSPAGKGWKCCTDLSLLLGMTVLANFPNPVVIP